MEDDVQHVISSMDLPPNEDALLRETHYIITRLLESEESSQVYADPQAILRFLRAREFNQEAAVLMWDKWRSWRVENNVDRMKLRDVAAVMSTGL